MFAIKACLYCVFTERCNQCNCERVFLTEMSVLFLPAWVQVGTCWIFFSQCFSFPNVNASLDLYRPLYTLLFFTFFFFLSFLFFLDQMQKNKGSFSEWDVSSDLCQRRWSLREKTVCSYPERAAEHTSKKKKTMASLAVGARRQCSPRPRVHLVEVKKKKVSAAPEDLDVVSESFWSHSCSARGIIFVNWRCMHAQSPQHSLLLILSMCLPFGSDYFIYGTRKTNRYHVSPWRRSFRLRHADRLRH